MHKYGTTQLWMNPSKFDGSFHTVDNQEFPPILRAIQLQRFQEKEIFAQVGVISENAGKECL
jgi:hypothetical protein